jgi:hypothetical protein
MGAGPWRVVVGLRAGSSASGSPAGAIGGATARPSTASPSPSRVPCPPRGRRPELTEGPYYVNENLDRSDIRIDTSDGSVSEAPS